MKINGKPDGGGGREPVVTSLSVTSNGIYTPATGVDGFTPVDVDVQPALESLSVTSNGTYTPGEGIDGYSQVSVNVQPTLGTLSVSVNNTYYPGQGVDGFSQVVVDVPQSVTGYTEKDLTEGYVCINDLNNSASFVSSVAFQNNSCLSTVNLPNVSIVYYAAFQNCRNLSQVSLATCTFISQNAFSDCGNLKSIYIPNCSYISSGVFTRTGFTILDLSEVKSIGSYGFSECKQLISISLPKCEILENDVFYSCTSLQDVYLPKCKTFKNKIFNSCPNLISISLPECDSMGQNMFQSCFALQDVYIPKCSELGAGAFSSCTSLSSIELPNVLIINNSTFNRCFALNSLSAPKTVIIGGLTFELCTSMSEYNFPNAVYVSGATFNQCPSNITTMSLPAFLSTSRWYGNGMFLNNQIDTVYLGTECYGVPSYADVMSGTTQITSLYVNAYEYSNYLTATGWSDMSSNILPYGDPSKPMLQFSDGLVYGDTKGIARNCKSYLNISSNDIIKVSLPECVAVTDNAFVDASSLNKVTLPKCRVITSSAFVNCRRLVKLELPGDEICYLLNGNNFPNTPIASNGGVGGYGEILVNQNLVDAYKQASNWSILSSRIFPYVPELSFSDGLVYGSTNTLDSTFMDTLSISANEITGISLPNVGYYGNDMFAGCTSLSEFNLTASAMGDRVFENCTGLQAVNIDYFGVVSIGNNVFNGCTSLESIYIKNLYFSDYLTASGWSEYSNLFVEVSYPELSFSDGLVYGSAISIDSTFKTTLGITESQVTAINLPECSYIGEYTFINCSNLQSINLPKCEIIGASAFNTTGSMTSRYITLNLPVCSNIKYSAFNRARHISAIILGSNSMVYISNPFNQVFGITECNIYVPDDLLNTYKTNFYWGQSSNAILPISQLPE